MANLLSTKTNKCLGFRISIVIRAFLVISIFRYQPILKSSIVDKHLKLKEPAFNVSDSQSGKWEDRLFTPTYATHCGGLYFIVDCWHHRVLYSDQWGPKLSNFFSIDGIAGPHSVACNERIAMMEDTGRGAVRAYVLADMHSSLQNSSQKLEYQSLSAGFRPHRTLYDSFTNAFYTINSKGDLYKFLNNNSNVTQALRKPEVAGRNCGYTRSFTIAEDVLLVACSTGSIRRIKYQDNYEMLGSYHSPRDLNDVYHASSGWWYVTSTFDGIWRVPSLDSLVYENNGTIIPSQNHILGLRGVPYYISEMFGRIIVPVIASPREADESAIISFHDNVNELELKEKHIICDFGRPQGVDHSRKKKYPM